MEHEIKILIVEDEALIAQNIKMQLEDFGYCISAVCYKYNTAIIAIAENEFDILITDINLGHGIDTKSGIHIAQQVQQTKNCPIIFLTAFSDKDTLKKVSPLSPSAYLVKPVNAANLFAAVQLSVENFNTQKAIEHSEAPDYFFVKIGIKLIKILWKDVYHLEAVKNYVKIKSSSINNQVLIRGSLQQVMQIMIPPHLQSMYVKINRSEAILKTIIIKVHKDIIVTTNGNYIGNHMFDIKKL